MAGMALGDIHLDITWQAWHNRISMMPRDFAWQAWHLVTSTLISRGTVFVFASFVLLACLVYVLFQHVGWSLRHGLISDMFSAFSDMFSTSLVYACAVYGRSGMLFLPFSACLSSGMFLLSACFGMFDFGMFKYFLLSACCIPHTHTCGQVLVLLVFATTGRAQLRYMCSTSLVYACPVYGRSGMLFLPICFLHVYYFLHVYLPACVFFPRVSACLILACLSTFFFRPAAFHTHTLAARCWSCSWSTGRAQLRLSNAVQRRHDRFCFLHADFHHVVLVVLFWSLWPN